MSRAPPDFYSDHVLFQAPLDSNPSIYKLVNAKLVVIIWDTFSLGFIPFIVGLLTTTT